MTGCPPHRPEQATQDRAGREGVPPRFAGAWYCTACGEQVYVCCGPGCSDSYGAWKVLAGEEPIAPGWRRHPTFGLVACPDHSALWTSGSGVPDGPHFPRLGRDPVEGLCACGTVLDGRTLGEMRDSYLEHLQAATPSPAFRARVRTWHSGCMARLSRHHAPLEVPPATKETLSLACASGDHHSCGGRVRLSSPGPDGRRFGTCGCGICNHRARESMARR